MRQRRHLTRVRLVTGLLVLGLLTVGTPVPLVYSQGVSDTMGTVALIVGMDDGNILSTRADGLWWCLPMVPAETGDHGKPEITALSAGTDGTSETLFAGTNDGYVWRMTGKNNMGDSSNSLRPVSITLGVGSSQTHDDTGFANATITALAGNGANVYAGAGRDGVYRTNTGLTSTVNPWLPFNLTLTTPHSAPVSSTTLIVNSLLFDHQTPPGIWIGVRVSPTSGLPVIYHSTDGGHNWTPISITGINNVYTIASSPVHGSTAVYVGTNDGYFQLDKDNGNWTKPGKRMLADRQVEALAVSGGKTPLVYAAWYASPSFGVSVAKGAGAPGTISTGHISQVTALLVEPVDPWRVYVATANGLYSAIDRPKSWTALPCDLLDCTAYATVHSLALVSHPVGGHGSSLSGRLTIAHALHPPKNGYQLSGDFRTFAQKHPGLAVFGPVLSEPFVADRRLMQYLANLRLEEPASSSVGHPELVHAAPLGRSLAGCRTFSFANQLHGSSPISNCHASVPPSYVGSGLYFSCTGHNLASGFLTYWLAHDGGVLLGPPISEEETTAATTVQWFQNGRLELKGHTVRPSPLGNLDLQQREWLP